MKRLFTLLIFLTGALSAKTQVLQVDTIQLQGSVNKYINLVVLGDGYTSAEQSKFRADADTLIKYLLDEAPWKNYKSYFNAFAIHVVSSQSGTKHPNTAPDCGSPSSVPVSNPNTYLGCTFDAFNIHRLVVPQNVTNVANVLSANFPAYDQVLVIANSPHYGGSGGGYATSTVNISSKEITAHEVGHSFARLADEYWAGDSYAAEHPNMTQQSNPGLVKWKNWVGTSGVGVFPYGSSGNPALWYKPHNNCKMQSLGQPFCNVCAETIVETIHSMVNPIVDYLPTASTISPTQQLVTFKLTKLMRPQPNTLSISWKLDGAKVPGNADSVQIDQSALAAGAHAVTVTVVDTTGIARVANHSSVHVSSVTWTLNVVKTGVRVSTSQNQFSYSVYPNPATNVLNVSVESIKALDLSIELISVEGKILNQYSGKTEGNGKRQQSFDVSGLSAGTYLIRVRAGDYVETKAWVKQ